MFKYITPTERFDFAVQEVIKNEGGFSNNPNDPGGATNYGISLRFLKEMNIHIDADPDIDIDDVKAISFTDAKELYKKYWWDKYHYEAINSLAVATKIFDIAVNMGAKQAHKIIQIACQYCGYSDLKIDGLLGGKTLAGLNEISLCGREGILRNEIIEHQEWFYEHLVENDSRLKVFLKGWLNRANWWPNVPA